ncbi:Hypothetical predicted protein [Octopus vulgaris]|uniref:Endonuclease/exonuclease/phosphatase domain-containing protein n=1 Tax=Octopus vulgaris TaxID=6645 RepID=A0AA36AWG2_OCTVU|nr:Hypothetical predicted protein [Octopus vulgaris]
MLEIDHSLMETERRVSSVICCTPASTRFITICVVASPQNIIIIQVYGPTLEPDEEFNDDLEKIAQAAPYDVLIVLGDWNAKKGLDTYDQWDDLGLEKPKTAMTIGDASHHIVPQQDLTQNDMACTQKQVSQPNWLPLRTSEVQVQYQQG